MRSIRLVQGQGRTRTDYPFHKAYTRFPAHTEHSTPRMMSILSCAHDKIPRFAAGNLYKRLQASLIGAGRSPFRSITSSIHDEYDPKQEENARMESVFKYHEDTLGRGSAQAPFHIESPGLRALTTHHIAQMKKYKKSKPKQSSHDGEDDPLGQVLQELATTAKNLDCPRSDLLNSIGLLCHSLLHRGQFQDVLRLQTLLKQGNVPVTPAIFGQILTASVMTRNVKSARDALRDLEEEQGESLTGAWYAEYIRQVWDDHLYLALYPLKDFLLDFHTHSLDKHHVRAIALACFHIGDKKAAMDALDTLVSKQQVHQSMASQEQKEQEVTRQHQQPYSSDEPEWQTQRAALEGVVQFGINTARMRMVSQQSSGRTLRFFNAGGVLNALLLLSQEHGVNVRLWESFLYYLLKAHVVSLPPRELTHSMPASFSSSRRESDVSLSMGKIVSMALEYCRHEQTQPPLKLAPLMLTRLFQMCYTKCNGCSVDDAELILTKLTPNNFSWDSHFDFDGELVVERDERSDDAGCEVVLRTLVDMGPANHVNIFIEQLAKDGIFPRSQKLHRDTVNSLQHSGLDLDFGGLAAYTSAFLDSFVEGSLDQLKEQYEVGFLKTFGERVKLVTRALMRMNDTERLHIAMAKGLENLGKILSYIAHQMDTIEESNCDEVLWDSLLEILHSYAAYLEFMDGRGPYAYIHQKDSKNSVSDQVRTVSKRTSAPFRLDKDHRAYHPSVELDQYLDTAFAAYESRVQILASLLRMVLDCRLNRFLETPAGKLELAKVIVTALDASWVPFYLSIAEGDSARQKNAPISDEEGWKLVELMQQASYSKLNVFVSRRIALYLMNACNGDSGSLSNETRDGISDAVSSVMEKIVRQFSMESQSRVEKHTGTRTHVGPSGKKSSKVNSKRRQQQLARS
eukprot:gb/GECG01007258.1/.p1 GENE.gb/GECG01007258.1/~~gb/GECG01007258.1/.p1  ORF type:complete len:911 (+),score=89.49 gb/GECG01007258.1/:1-2733(+)